eukprot:scaffold8770_cov62-Phaeocystis_antarctica.AAC.1
MRAAGRSRRARHSREWNSVHIFACFYCGWQAPCASVLTAAPSAMCSRLPPQSVSRAAAAAGAAGAGGQSATGSHVVL